MNYFLFYLLLTSALLWKSCDNWEQKQYYGGGSKYSHCFITLKPRAPGIQSWKMYLKPHATFIISRCCDFLGEKLSQ